MKAIVVREFGEPDVMLLEDVPTPQPTGTQVLVRIEAAGVNPVDTYLRTGNHAHAPKLPYVRDQGADAVFDHSADGYLGEIREQTGDRGVDIIIEMLANVNLQKDFEALAMFGRITVVGNRGSLDFTPRAIMNKDATIYGMSLFNAPRQQLDEIHTAIYNGLSEGFLKPVVRSTYALTEAPAAHHAVIETKALGKIVLIPDSSA